MDSSSSTGGEMGFWEHVDALRSVLLRSFAVIAAISIVALVAMPHFFDRFILAPCRCDFPLYRLLDGMNGVFLTPDFSTPDFHVELINIRLASQFLTHVSVSLWLATIASTPIILYFLWQFIAPALYVHERRAVGRAFAGGALLFYLGMATGYFIVFPITLRFLAEYQISSMVVNQISLDSYIDNFMMQILIMGLLFELPVVTWMLGQIGLLSRATFRRYRRHAIVALLILAAIVTPTGDPFTLFIVFLPIYALWEIGALLVPSNSQSSQSQSQS